MMVVSGVAFPLALAHSGVIAPMACIMAVSGGALVYGTSEYPKLGNSASKALDCCYLRHPSHFFHFF